MGFKIEDFKVVLTFDDGSYKISDGTAEITVVGPDRTGNGRRGAVGGGNPAGWGVVCDDLREQGGAFTEIWYPNSMHATTQYFAHVDHPHFTGQFAAAPRYRR